MKYIYFPEMLTYAGAVPDDAPIPYCLTTPPPDAPDVNSIVVADVAQGQWVTRPLNAVELDVKRSGARAAVQSAYDKAIAAGFQSSALGSAHTYLALPADLDKLHQAVTTSCLPITPANWSMPYLCSDGEGAWSLRSHSASQIQQVGFDAGTAVGKLAVTKAELSLAIEQAADNAAIQAVVWPS
ncbi:hypothetical protein G3O06_20430 [Burkholderia sp. Ac-20345]|uniref:hypothetical protein n=1 Tax=Burkholderia sp. Ac-20345 TaxID=2703891 RepID=UPI00197B5E77|nr:hypothetical protein [Burkholderia sp. Ac-20345]MBN3779906.1 hypothetical protein [Burkholderia sp. Ac-20345]